MVTRLRLLPSFSTYISFFKNFFIISVLEGTIASNSALPPGPLVPCSGYNTTFDVSSVTSTPSIISPGRVPKSAKI